MFPALELGRVYTILGLLGLPLIRDLLPSCPLALFVRALVVAKSAPAATQAARALADAAAASSFFRNFVGTSLAMFAFPGVGTRCRLGDHHRMGSDAHAANDLSLILGRAGTLGGGGGSLWATLAADEQPVARLGWRR